MKPARKSARRARALAVFGGLLIGFAGLLGALAGLLALVAFSDAADRCPGMQCSDAIGSGVTYCVIAAFCAALVALGFRVARRDGPR